MRRCFEYPQHMFWFRNNDILGYSEPTVNRHLYLGQFMIKIIVTFAQAIGQVKQNLVFFV